MPQLVNLFLVIFGVIAVGTGLAGLRSQPASLLMPETGTEEVKSFGFRVRRAPVFT
jgi:hypothetical protein